MHFYKYHGLGNDFVLTPDLDGSLQATPERAVAICNRHTGIGADGWMLIRKSETCDIQMFLYNSDGSVAEMCGNGLRCFAKFVYDYKIVEKEDFTVQTPAGVMVVHVTPEDGAAALITANIGKPALEKQAVPMVGQGICDRETVAVLDTEFTISACLMGVPHVVVFGRDFDDAQTAKYGPVLECHPLFPRKANINFVNLIDEHTIHVRTWERGCGRTLACGTGASASAVLCYKAGFTKDRVEVRLQEGSLLIHVTDDGVIMTGPAAFAFEGETNL